MHRFARSAVACVVLAGFAATGLAQQERPPRGDQPAGERPQRRQGGGGGMTALSPEKAKAAWEMQAQGVAGRLKLSDEQTKALTKAYVEARESQGKAAQQIREEMREKMQDEGVDRRELMQDQQKKIQDLEKAESEKLEKALGSALSADQAKDAMKSLGRFSPQWDNMAYALAGFNLEASKRQAAMDAVESFVIAQPRLGRMGEDVDREAMREQMQASRDKLNDALSKVLTEEQMEQFEATTRGGRGRGPGAPGEGPGGDRPRRNRDDGGR